VNALAAGCAALVVLVLLPTAAPALRRRRPCRDRARRVPSRRARALVAAAVSGGAVALLVGGTAGLAAGTAVAGLVALGLPRLETRSARDRRLVLAGQAPLVVDLVAACLASGATLEASLSAAATAVGPPAAEGVHRAVAALRLGAEPRYAWADVDPALEGLARAAIRSADSGAPLADLLPRAAAEARATHRGEVEARVRTAAVRLTAPLGAAFLPAFVLLGVVPVVASWVGVLL
jgi:pilus assembly protein TadC